MPFFSIIVPTYNRVQLVGRALDSALSQDCGDFEIVVVDSASNDGTRDVVRGYAERDPRVRLICEEERRGVCPARNTAIDAARGEWIVPLDSDDELPPGTLSLFRAKIDESPGVDHFRFLCRWDNGSVSPRPPFGEETWDYDGFLRFLERTAAGGNTESMSCIRRSTFAVTRFPDDRAYETLYHLDFAKRFVTKTYPVVARLYHTDAENQNSFVPNPAHWLRVAPDVARSMDRVFELHGQAIRRAAPRFYADMLQTAAKFHYLCGRRLRGLRYLLRYWRYRPAGVIGWGIFVSGTLGPRAVAWADAFTTRLRRRAVS